MEIVNKKTGEVCRGLGRVSSAVERQSSQRWRKLTGTGSAGADRISPNIAGLTFSPRGKKNIVASR